MDRQEQLKYCKKCKNKKFDRNKGIVCGLTNDYPAFQSSCNDYDEDPKLRELEEKKQQEEEFAEKDKQKIRFTAISMFGILFLEIVLIYFINDWHNTGTILSRIVGFTVFGVMFLAAYHDLPFFAYRFRRGIRFWGKERMRKIVMVSSGIFILALLCIRNF